MCFPHYYSAGIPGPRNEPSIVGPRPFRQLAYGSCKGGQAVGAVYVLNRNRNTAEGSGDEIPVAGSAIENAIGLFGLLNSTSRVKSSVCI